MEALKIRKMIGETIRAAGIAIWLLGTDFVSGLLRGFLGFDLALNEIYFLGNSLCHWGIILVVGGYILKMFRKGLSMKTKLLVFIPCAIYLLLLTMTLVFPVSGMNQMTFSDDLQDVLAALMVIVSLAFWGTLLSGLYRMYRETTELDQVDKN